MYKILFFAALGLFFTLIIVVKPTLAADCTVVYGGGTIDCSKITPTPVATQTTQTQTKGGLQVKKPTNASKTPATGPEALGLISLVPMAAAGFWLRKTQI